jgi:hypothetical protein
MAFPVINGNATTSGASTTTPVVNLPASIVSGETLLVVLRGDNWGTGTVPTFPAGWTTLITSQGDSSDDGATVGWRKADGAEGATITFGAGTNAGKFAAVAVRIGSAADPTVTAPSSALAESSVDSANPDPPSLTPAGGAKDYLWLAVGTWEGEQTIPATMPTNYTIVRHESSGTGGAIESNCQCAMAERDLNAATEDPGTFTISVSDAWAAATIAVHPVGAFTPTADLLTTHEQPIFEERRVVAF